MKGSLLFRVSLATLVSLVAAFLTIAVLYFIWPRDMAPCSTNLSLTDAAHAWWSGLKLDNACIASVSAVSIGRLAKLVAFLSSVPIIIDLMGEARLNDLSRSLGDKLRRRQIAGMVATSRFLAWLEAKSNPGEVRTMRDAFRSGLSFKFSWEGLGFALAYIVTGVGLYYFGYASSPNWAAILSFAILLGGIIAFSALVVAVAILPTLAVVWLGLIVGVLRNDTLCWRIRLVALPLFVSSVFMDMFVSS